MTLHRNSALWCTTLCHIHQYTTLYHIVSWIRYSITHNRTCCTAPNYVTLHLYHSTLCHTLLQHHRKLHYVRAQHTTLHCSLPHHAVLHHTKLTIDCNPTQHTTCHKTPTTGHNASHHITMHLASCHNAPHHITMHWIKSQYTMLHHNAPCLMSQYTTPRVTPHLLQHVTIHHTSCHTTHHNILQHITMHRNPCHNTPQLMSHHNTYVKAYPNALQPMSQYTTPHVTPHNTSCHNALQSMSQHITTHVTPHHTYYSMSQCTATHVMMHHSTCHNNHTSCLNAPHLTTRHKPPYLMQLCTTLSASHSTISRYAHNRA